MRAVVRFVRCYSIVIGKLPVDLRTKVRECGTKIHVELSHTRLVRSCVRLRCVIDEIVGKEFVENLEPTLALDLFGNSAYNRFRCGRWSDAVHFASLPLINRFTDRVEEAFQVSAQHIALNDKTSELAFSNDFDQTRRFQLFGVMGECGWADSVRLVQDSEWRRASTHRNLLENPKPSRLRQGSSNSHKLALINRSGIAGPCRGPYKAVAHRVPHVLRLSPQGESLRRGQRQELGCLRIPRSSQSSRR